MAVEYSYLVASIIVLIMMIVVQLLASLSQHGLVSLAGARDHLSPDNAFVSRAKRANQNMIEALCLFAPVMLVAVASGNANEMTAMGGGLFLAGRIAYAPLYWFGVAWLRTLAWTVAFVGIVLVILQVLPFTGAA